MSERPFTHISFNQYLAEHRLMGSRCQRCGAVHLPPRVICATCHAAQMEWVELSGMGKLTGFSTIYFGPKAMIEAGYSREKPYCAGIVKLEEGPSISAQILGVDVSAPERIEIGIPVRAAFFERGQAGSAHPVLAFEYAPAGEAGISAP